jgi:parvulin-like peptidyl-prolyl isomerase
MGILGGARAHKGAALFFCGLAAAGLLVAGCTPKPVAEVNGTRLTEKEFYHLTETVNTSELVPQGPTVGMQVLAQWISNAILAQEARRLNVYPTEQELEARLDAIRKRTTFMGQDFDMGLQQQGLSLADYRERLLHQLISENVMLRGVEVSEEELKREFEARKEEFGEPETVRISQITVDSEAKLKEARNDLGSNADFALVASTYSRDPFQPGGGKVPARLPRQVQPGGPVDQQVVDVAFRMKEGEVSEPLQVGASWVIVRLDEKVPARMPEFAEVKELVRKAMREAKAHSAPEIRQNRQALEEAMQKAEIKINRPEYQSLLAQFAPPPGGPNANAGGPLPAGMTDSPGHEGHGH